MLRIPDFFSQIIATVGWGTRLPIATIGFASSLTIRNWGRGTIPMSSASVSTYAIGRLGPMGLPDEISRPKSLK